MSYLPLEVEVSWNQNTLIFNQEPKFILYDQNIQMHEEVICDKNSRTPRQGR
jgi:hypothetical protein